MVFSNDDFSFYCLYTGIHGANFENTNYFATYFFFQVAPNDDFSVEFFDLYFRFDLPILRMDFVCPLFLWHSNRYSGDISTFNVGQTRESNFRAGHFNVVATRRRCFYDSILTNVYTSSFSDRLLINR